VIKVFLFVVACGVSAWAQAKTGTVVVYLSVNDEIIVAADSRVVNAQTGRHSDKDCKLCAFGKNFFFVSAGAAAQEDPSHATWSGVKDAHDAWKDASRLDAISAAQSVTHDAAKRWASVMQSHFDNPEAMASIRPILAGAETNVIAAAMFGYASATEVAATRVIIKADMPPELHDVPTGQQGEMSGLGFGEIVNEYVARQTPRAKQFMSSYQEGRLTSKEYRDLAAKLVQLSIDLHPKRAFLGPPIDELTLQRGKGITWLQVKPNCQNPPIPRLSAMPKPK